MEKKRLKENILCLEKLMGVSSGTEEKPGQNMEKLMLEFTGKDISKCPQCKIGTMTLLHPLPGERCPYKGLYYNASL